jgi:hypothetical protein
MQFKSFSDFLMRWSEVIQKIIWSTLSAPEQSRLDPGKCLAQKIFKSPFLCRLNCLTITPLRTSPELRPELQKIIQARYDDKVQWEKMRLPYKLIKTCSNQFQLRAQIDSTALCTFFSNYSSDNPVDQAFFKAREFHILRPETHKITVPSLLFPSSPSPLRWHMWLVSLLLIPPEAQLLMFVPFSLCDEFFTHSFLPQVPHCYIATIWPEQATPCNIYLLA